MPNLTLMVPESGRTLKLWDGRATMRTLADGLAKLEELGGISHSGDAEVRTTPLHLPGGQRSAIVTVIGAQSSAEWAIMMPSAAHFDAAGTLGDRQKFAISKLDGAITDAAGNVTLSDGTYVHNVELRPTIIIEELTALQQHILYQAICSLGAKDRCYRRPDDSLPPNFRLLDYHAVAELGMDYLPSLKTIEAKVRDQIPEVSRQTIATALAIAGLRLPRSGPRAV